MNAAAAERSRPAAPIGCSGSSSCLAVPSCPPCETPATGRATTPVPLTPEATLTVSIRSFAPHEWRLYRELRLRALEDSPDAFGSTWALEAERPDEAWSSNLAAGATSASNYPILAEHDGEPAGLAWVRLDDDDRRLARLYSVWVAPERRGLGIGRAVLEAAIEWARLAGARTFLLSVSRDDSPAMHLYRRAGFTSAGDPVPLRDGSAVMAYPMGLVIEAIERSEGRWGVGSGE